MTSNASHFKLPHWSIFLPLLTIGMLAVSMHTANFPGFLLAISLSLVAAVLITVYHAEVIAHWLGEPLGTLILALAVTMIEVSLIVSMMLSGAASASTLARDTVFATVMIICNGVIGLCVTVGALRHRVIAFRAEGSTSALSVLAALTTLTLILPEFTTSTSGPTYTVSQLTFAGLMSLILYGVFIFVQTVRHRDFFLPNSESSAGEDTAHPHPGKNAALASIVLLLTSLVAVVGLAKALAPAIQQAVLAVRAPIAVVGVAIALLILLPETIAALRAAFHNRLQTSLNLALGSALATIGLTIPAVAIASIYLDIPLVLGLSAKDIVLLSLTLLISAITLASGRATVLQGTVHLVVFFAFLFLALVP